MARTSSSSTARQDAPRGARRLSRETRREQLIEAATRVIVEQGLFEFSLDDVAARADVTRNLLYHYFPRGRRDILLAVGERVGHELTDGWVTDARIPLAQRMLANSQRLMEHAMTPTDAWVLYRRARAADYPELNEIIDRFDEAVLSSVSLNQLGTADPPPLVRLALKGHLAFTGAVLDEARAIAAPRDKVLRIIAETLLSAVQSGVSTSE